MFYYAREDSIYLQHNQKLNHMKKLFAIAILAMCLASCSVQHFNVNTSDSGTGWKAFGEKTRGKEIAKGGDFFLIGISISQTDTKYLAEKIKASSYTIETKFNFLGWLVNYASFGLIDYKVVKVIKR